MTRELSGFIRDQRGAVAIEFAIILPVMLLLFCGTFEVSRIIRAVMTLGNAAQTMANLVAQQGSAGISSTNIAGFCTAAQLAMSPFPGASLGVTVASVTKNPSSGNIAFDWQDTLCGGGAGTWLNATTASAGRVSNADDTLIIVKANYNYSSSLHFVLPASLQFSQNAYQRPRSGNTIPHS